MKVLWVNPSFLDYRIPLYNELNKLLNGVFHLIYSRKRIPKRCDIKIQKILGENAHGLERETCISFGKRKSEFANSFVSLPVPRGLYKQIKSVHADVIIAEGFFQFTPWALLYSFIYRKPLLIAYERTEHTERNCPLWRKLYRKFINLFICGYIVNGKLTKEYLISLGVKAEYIFTGGMCADSEDLASMLSTMNNEQKISLKKNIGIKDIIGITYLYVGQLIERKGVGYLLNAWREHVLQYPDDKLIIVGDGPLLSHYRNQYEDLISILFIGSIDYSHIYKYYAISDVFIIPTLEDNWSLVVPEAMACGLPIACSIYNGCYPDLIQEGVNGMTFDPLRKDTIINTLYYFHHVDLKSFGESSIRIEQNFNPHKTALNIFNAVKAFI